MDIPARLVVRKMEEELAKLKASLDDPDSTTRTAYRDHAQSITTYCELLLECDLVSDQSPKQTPTKTQQASAEEIKAKMLGSFADTQPQSKSGASEKANSKTDDAETNVDAKTNINEKVNPKMNSKSKHKERQPIYDDADDPDSDSIFDF